MRGEWAFITRYMTSEPVVMFHRFSFSYQNLEDSTPNWLKLASRPEITYERSVLLQMAKSPLCARPPAAWETIAASYPVIVKREGPTSKHFLREMASLRKQEAAKLM